MLPINLTNSGKPSGDACWGAYRLTWSIRVHICQNKMNRTAELELIRNNKFMSETQAKHSALKARIVNGVGGGGKS